MAPLRDCAHLYSTNAVPNPQEAKALQREIDNLKSRIRNLKSQLQELEEELHQHETVLSPVRRTPVEVLGQVFSLALPVTLESYDRERLLDFCLVCKLWRDAALAARWVWGSVKVSSDELSYAFEGIVSWLNRSGDFPKSLEVYSYFDCGELDERCKSRNVILAKLLTDGPLLDHLHLHYKDSKCFWNLVEALHIHRAIAKSITRPWDILRSLALVFYHHRNASGDEADSPFHHTPSSITSLSFRFLGYPRGPDDTPDIPQLHIPPYVLQRLTCLTFKSDWMKDRGLQLLKHCQNVETLTLDISCALLEAPNDLTHSERTDSMVHLPQLRTLCLRQVLAGAVNLFVFLDTPNLISLDIQFQDCELETQSFATVLSFIERSKCQNTFRRLTIRDCTLIDEELETLCYDLPFITHLRLDNVSIQKSSPINRNIFRELSFTLPHLQTLELLESPPQLFFSDVDEFLQARRPWLFCDDDFALVGPPHSLKKVIVTYKDTGRAERSSDHDSSYIRALRRSGMLVSVGPLK